MSWTLTNRKTGKSLSFKTLETACKATTQAAAKYGTRWVSLQCNRFVKEARTGCATQHAKGGDK